MYLPRRPTGKNWASLTNAHTLKQNPLNLWTNAGLSTSNLLALLPQQDSYLFQLSLHSCPISSELSTPNSLCAHLHPTAPNPPSPPLQLERVAAPQHGDKWQIWVILSSSLHSIEKSHSGLKTALCDLAPQQQKRWGLKCACTGRAAPQTLSSSDTTWWQFWGMLGPELEEPKQNTVPHLSREVSPQKRSAIISVKNNKEETNCPNWRNCSKSKHNSVFGNPTLKCKIKWSMQQRATGCTSQWLNDNCQNITEFEIPYGCRYNKDNIPILDSNTVQYVKNLFSSFIYISLYLIQNSNCVGSFLQHLIASSTFYRSLLTGDTQNLLLLKPIRILIYKPQTIMGLCCLHSLTYIVREDSVMC